MSLLHVAIDRGTRRTYYVHDCPECETVFVTTNYLHHYCSTMCTNIMHKFKQRFRVRAKKKERSVGENE